MSDNTRLMIDGSHMRASDLDYLIIRLAILDHSFAAHMGSDDWRIYEEAARDFPENVSGLTPDQTESLRWLSEVAMAHMSEHSGGYANYYVDDSCLWVVFDEPTED